MTATNLATMPNDPPASAEPGGWEDYAGEFDPHFELEDLSHRALVLVATELALQGHLLARGCMWAVEERYGVDEAVDVGRKLFAGVGWVTAERLLPVLGLTGESVADVAKVLQIDHVLLLRDYLGLSITMPDDDTVLVSLARGLAGARRGRRVECRGPPRPRRHRDPGVRRLGCESSGPGGRDPAAVGLSRGVDGHDR
ncbi:MAG: hypothetical protein U5R31_07190 [Acidimicrobiia bacterium]|nr:hypothetical protein [Acidimicrobiia bacterium]